MKLGSLKGGRDGRLVVVSRDLAWCADAGHIAPTLQAALDDWATVAPRLEALATDLAHEVIPMMRFHERDALAPLPRAYGWVAGAAQDSDARIERRASDGILPPRAAIALGREASGCDCAAGVIVVTDDVPRDADRATALAAVRLIGLVNAIVPSGDPARSGVMAAMSPVLVTPDELGDRWEDGRLRNAPAVEVNGRAQPGAEVGGDAGTLIAQLARSGAVGAGGVIALDGIAVAAASGDTVRIRVDDEAGHAIFGTIEQTATSG